MYRRVGCETKDILTEIEGWSEAERARAYAIIHEMETEALATMRRMPGAATLGAFLDATGVPRGLVTRNVKPPSRTSTPTPGRSKEGDQRSPQRSRGSSNPISPRSGRPLAHLRRVGGCTPEVCAIGGRLAKDDVVSGNRAGCVTILLDAEGGGGGRGGEGEDARTANASVGGR